MCVCGWQLVAVMVLRRRLVDAAFAERRSLYRTGEDKTT
jgi:hypothetical protein